MKKVLVTGANGYIGRHVVNELLKMGCSVIASDFCFDDVSPDAIRCGAEIFSGSKNIFEETGKPDICIHLAWKDGFIHNSPQHMLNLSKHYEFLSNLIDGGCKNIAVMGTMHEVGYWEGKIDEGTPCNPLSQYGIAKNALRQALLLLQSEKEFNLYWLRAFYIVGDDTRNHSIFAKILSASMEGKKIFPFTSGKNQYDFIEVTDLAKQIAAASLQQKYTGIINVCTGNPMELGARVEQFISINKLDIQLEYGMFPDRKYDSPIVYGDSKKINDILKGV